MALPRIIPALLGSISVLATAGLVVVHIVLAHTIQEPNSPVTVTAILSSISEACVLALLGWLCSLYFSARPRDPFAPNSGVWFGVLALFCTAATAISAAMVVSLNSVTDGHPERIPFVTGALAALAISFVAQLAFLVVHFFLVRTQGLARGPTDAEEGDRRMIPQVQVKSIPYTQTSPALAHPQGSSVSLTPPGSRHSTAETMSSIRSSLSHVVRPITSRTRLLTSSQKSLRRPGSLDSNAYRDRSSVGEDAFDSWDTSSVDTHNRQMVMQSTGSSIGGHFLETIPASPTVSRSPSPGTPLDLVPPSRPGRSRSPGPPLDLMPPPRPMRRSRSYSPVSERVRMQPTTLPPPPPNTEAHIHPLFRSDSPTPPPIAKPGTVVTAAPYAGQLIAPDPNGSIRVVTRRRSGSLPTAASPLSQSGSFEEIARAAERNSVREEEEEEVVEERKESQPIPEWIMTAGSRTSLYGYNSRKKKIDGEDGEKPVRHS